MTHRTIPGTVNGSGWITANGAEVDPISRIEGHLGVKLVTDGTGVTEANMHGNMWRGFENFLLGREPNDPITFTQRICGVCPVPHGMTSTYAADAVFGYSDGYMTFSTDGAATASDPGVPPKAVLMRNIVLGEEFLMSHLTHFYHLVAQDYVQGPAIPPWTPYFADSYMDGLNLLNSVGKGMDVGGTPTVGPARGQLPYVEDAVTGTGYSHDLWSAVILQYVTALRVRRLTFEAGGLFAGRMPFTSSFVAGGVTIDKTEDLTAKLATAQALTEEIADFCVRSHIPLVLALGALYPAYDNSGNGGSGFGAGTGNFLAWGAFPQIDDSVLIGGGVKLGAAATVPLATNRTTCSSSIATIAANLKESIFSSRYADTLGEYDGNLEAYPGDVTRTEPSRDSGYSYIKAPRWAGNSCEVGPYARMAVNGIVPVDGVTTYASTTPGYLAYTTTVNAQFGLDPKMVHPDIAVALVVSGAAALRIWDGAIWTLVDNGTAGVDISTLDKATIDAAYTGVSSFGDPVIIDGPAVSLVSFIAGLIGGLSTIDRIRGRAIETLVLSQAFLGSIVKGAWGTGFGGSAVSWAGSGWFDQLAAEANTATFSFKPQPVNVQRFGATEAPRGALFHISSVGADGKLDAYQCVVPTTWNASPHDFNGSTGRGPIEQAMIGIPFDGTDTGGGSFVNQASATIVTQGGVEALRVAHSFDPCIACAVH